MAILEKVVPVVPMEIAPATGAEAMVAGPVQHLVVQVLVVMVRYA
jgi:hypothetical protein